MQNFMLMDRMAAQKALKVKEKATKHKYKEVSPRQRWENLNIRMKNKCKPTEAHQI